MRSFCKVYQLESKDAYFNVDNEFEGGVCVWGFGYKKKTVLAQQGNHFYFMQFDNDAYYDEWMTEHKDSFQKLH